jgi:hypothetical protein
VLVRSSEALDLHDRKEKLQLVPTPRDTETSANGRHLYKPILKKIIYLIIYVYSSRGLVVGEQLVRYLGR